MTELLAAVALIFVIEGLIYALFPDMVRRMMTAALATDPRLLRVLGATSAVTGVILVWIIKQLH